MDLVRFWYDGYIIGNTKVFCPWDVVNYVVGTMDDPYMEPENYWKNTSSNGIIRSIVECTFDDGIFNKGNPAGSGKYR